jgi:hypothetical protein
MQFDGSSRNANESALAMACKPQSFGSCFLHPTLWLEKLFWLVCSRDEMQPKTCSSTSDEDPPKFS